MPPKKKSLEKGALRLLIREYGIEFEGPVPRRKWPPKLRHSFEIVWKIDALRYEEYMNDHQTYPKHNKPFLQERIKTIRRQVYKLLDDANINESTWRDLEPLLFEKLHQPVICERCHNELWQGIETFEANALSSTMNDRLAAKRIRRRICSCAGKRNIPQAEVNDEEKYFVFQNARDGVISHDPEDYDLRNVSIPMTPDRVYGLDVAPQTEPHPDIFPVVGNSILLPFLVVEAKRGENVPGFRSIQCQSAFPIRRLLKAQHSLFSKDSSTDQETPLVWFFGYQGDQWRLHGCTYEYDENQGNHKVRIYDLWQGSIQSQDGALQLLLLVDYIRSWARDVYRLAVMGLITHSIEWARAFSPASSHDLRYSVPPSSIASTEPTMDSVNSMQIDQDHETDMVYSLHDSDDDEESPVDQDRLSPLHTEFGDIYYSNCVCFQLRTFKMWKEVCHPACNRQRRATYDVLFRSSFLIYPQQLYSLFLLWPSIDSPTKEVMLSKPIRVTIFFQTYMNHTTWQIVRSINFVQMMTKDPDSIVTANSSRFPGVVDNLGYLEPINMDDLRKAIVDARDIHISESALLALRDVRMILSVRQDFERPMWTSFEDAAMPPNTSDIFSNSAGITNFGAFSIVNGSSYVKFLRFSPATCESPSPSAMSSITVPGLESMNGNSMLVSRSSSRSKECPELCLFIHSNRNYDEREIYQFLRDAVEQKNVFSEDMRPLSASQREKIHNWAKALQDKVRL
ncbi:hypothetical protein B0J11DRAFT_298105 [Dendryphion nanum]|uniref:Uncharacterized protein n=1 Tax=Dendryphion nanum TaxID=256645 RepID=A0A9P9DSE7_9PLEO|nr:hypothetical protein B0J11DRAFT_298105 [Dendryphion nanum]